MNKIFNFAIKYELRFLYYDIHIRYIPITYIYRKIMNTSKTLFYLKLIV